MLPATNDSFSKPGRQITIFLFLYNLAQWLVYTFEVQKVRASLVSFQISACSKLAVDPTEH
jgi:Otopetrin